MKAVIMAGGKGTRIASINAEVPKPMIIINHKPILEYQIECLSSQGITEIIIIVGHLGQVIIDYFGSGGNYGVNIEYFIENEPLGTAGALYNYKGKIEEDFLLINGDIIFDVEIKTFLEFHKEKKAIATLMTHPNDHPFDSAIIVTDNNQKVIKWLHKEDERGWYKNRVNSGIHILSPEILDYMKELKKIDLDRDIFKPLIATGKLYAYDTPEYIKDMGTPERYYSVSKDIISGKVAKRNLKNKQKAIFLDRDGVINKYKGFLTDIKEMELIDGAAKAIKEINSSEYLAIIITNQPIIARGEVDWDELSEIHNKMETLIGEEGAYIDDIFICPHHPDTGYEGERKEYKIECECRKPKPGLILEAKEKYNIDLENSWMVGDHIRDVHAGNNAGCKTGLLGQSLDSDFVDLSDFVKKILSGKGK